MMKKKKIKKPLKKRTIFTILAMVNIMWYTVVVLIAGFLDHNIDSSLTVAWFAAWTTELALLFGIKIKDPEAEEDDISFVEEIPATTETVDGEELDNNDHFEEMDLAEPVQNIPMDKLVPFDEIEPTNLNENEIIDM